MKAASAKDWGLAERDVIDLVAEAIDTAHIIAKKSSPDVRLITRKAILIISKGDESEPKFMAEWQPKLQARGNMDEAIRAEKKPDSPSRF